MSADAPGGQKRGLDNLELDHHERPELLTTASLKEQYAPLNLSVVSAAPVFSTFYKLSTSGTHPTDMLEGPYLGKAGWK